MDYPVELMGLSLKHPILTAAGPWARDGASIQRCVDAGAAAVITETITLDANPVLRPRLYYDDGRLFNIMLYSDLQLEQWEAELESVRLGDCKLIASIWASTPSELAYLAARVERMGAHGIEISISAPVGTRNKARSDDPVQITSFLQAVTEAVDIPVMVKLSYEAAVSSPFVRSIQNSGGAAVSAIDALKGLQGVDLEHRRPRMPTYGGYSGASIRPVALAATAILKQYSSLQICSAGGVENGRHVLEYLMLGARAVQLGTVLQLEGYGAITRIVEETEDWLNRNGISRLDEIRGSALPALFPFEDIAPQPLVASVDSCPGDCPAPCLQGCLYGALSMRQGRPQVEPSLCQGCGLCAARCPAHAIQLTW